MLILKIFLGIIHMTVSNIRDLKYKYSMFLVKIPTTIFYFITFFPKKKTFGNKHHSVPNKILHKIDLIVNLSKFFLD